MAYNAWFQCINGCPGEYSLLEVIYRCPTCGDLLEVQHDVEALRTRSAAAWMQLFDDRYRRNIYPYGSGVWGKRSYPMAKPARTQQITTDHTRNIITAIPLAFRIKHKKKWLEWFFNSVTRQR